MILRFKSEFAGKTLWNYLGRKSMNLKKASENESRCSGCRSGEFYSMAKSAVKRAARRERAYSVWFFLKAASQHDKHENCGPHYYPLHDRAVAITQYHRYRKQESE